ncbi:uncharacterized protein [Pocillopora verrucosa]|uniref:uncharacterized protein isoform X1 n=1 Tax=Pocillopora verrucosa TaxID=203993 RepID=UPI00333FC234
MEPGTLVRAFLIVCGAMMVSAQEWKNVGNCGAGLKCGPQCQRLCLIQHNYYRSLHNSPPLKCDPNLAKSAQSWADSNANHDAVQRSTPTKNYVESISWKRWGWEGMGTRLGAIPSAVRSWYSELKRGYDYNTGLGKGIVSHFKSVVDARETHLGCGIRIKPGDGTYVVAHYLLRPRLQFKLNDFSSTKNIGLPKQPDPQCQQKSFEREQCGDFKSPFITPDKCLNAGCCYDDMFMDEPGLQWYSPNASLWCFNKKKGADTGLITHVSTSGTMSFQSPPPPRKEDDYKVLQTQSSEGSVQVRPPCPEAKDVLNNIIGLVNAVTKLAASKGCGKAVAGPGPVSQLPSKPTTGPTAATSPSPSLTSSSSSTAGPTSGPTTISAKGAKQGEEPCFGNTCYMISETGKSWDENQKNCKASGGDLVSLETEAEWQFVNSKIQNITLQGANEWHIGLKKQGDWKWVNGNPMTIEKWQRSQPSGDGNVAVMSKDYPPGSQGLFNDLNAQMPRPFICEIPKGASPQPGPQPTSKPAVGPTEAPAPSSSPTSSTTKPTSGTTSQPAGGATSEMTGFEKDCLKAHNEYRAKHGVPPLKWSAELAADALEWAKELAVKNYMEHDYDSINNKGQGENLAYFQPGDPSAMPTQCQGPKTKDCVQCREMVADWYAEESNFDYNTGESKGGVILHFTQVVWKETTELGMATATSADKWFSVARYKPRGNMGNPSDYIKNVPRPQVNV